MQVLPADIRQACAAAAKYGRACHEARIALNAWLQAQTPANEQRLFAALDHARRAAAAGETQL